MMCVNRHHYSGTHCHLCELPPEKKKPKRIPKVGAKMKVRLVQYSFIRKAKLEAHPICQVESCGQNSTECHHIAGRVENDLVEAKNLLAVCSDCHKYIEMNPLWAKLMGYSKSRLC